MTTNAMKPAPFTVEIDQAVLDDLKYRLKNTRFPHVDERVAGWSNGTSLAYMKELVRYWSAEFDWRKSEQEINSFANYKTTIDGIELHFVHEKSKKSDAKAILLTHGWPDSFYRFHKLIPLLTGEYDVVIPSIPGFGFSEPKAVSTDKVAELWQKLMTEVLGYEKFLAHGGDTGEPVTMALARNHGDVVEAVHLTGVGWNGGEPDPETTTETEKRFLEAQNIWWFSEGAYAMVHGTKPLSLAYGLSDSPAGLAAWMISVMDYYSVNHDIEAAFGSRDELLTNITLYWVTQTAGSSLQIYKGDWGDEAEVGDWGDGTDSAEWGAAQPEIINTPAALTIYPRDRDIPREYAERQGLNIQRFKRFDDGGHFPALEMPEQFAQDIRKAFQALVGEGK